MERKLKERVVGAVLLVLAGVIFIPWLLDGRDAPRDVTQPLALPQAGDSALKTRTISLDAARPAASTSQGDGLPGATAPAPVRIETAKPAPETAVASSSTTTASPVPAPQPAAPVRSPPPAAKPSGADPAAAWAVQVGSFSGQGNAQRLAERLKRLGYKAFVSRKVVADRVMYRVRVGPEASRDAAAQLAERLRADKQPVNIVEHPG